MLAGVGGYPTDVLYASVCIAASVQPAMSTGIRWPPMRPFGAVVLISTHILGDSTTVLKPKCVAMASQVACRRAECHDAFCHGERGLLRPAGHITHAPPRKPVKIKPKSRAYTPSESTPTYAFAMSTSGPEDVNRAQNRCASINQHAINLDNEKARHAAWVADCWVIRCSLTKGFREGVSNEGIHTIPPSK